MEQAIDKFFPTLIKGHPASAGVGHLEDRRQADRKWVLGEEAAGKSVQGRDGRAVDRTQCITHRVIAPGRRALLQLFNQPIPEFGRRRLGERDGGNVIHACGSAW